MISSVSSSSRANSGAVRKRGTSSLGPAAAPVARAAPRLTSGVANAAAVAAIISRRERSVVSDHFDPRGLEHLAPRRDHVLGHLALVVRELVVEAQHRNAPGICGLGIQVDVALVAGQDLTEGAHADEGPGVIAHGFLELGA